MKELKTVFKANLTRYNFGHAFARMSSEYNDYPTEEQLLEFLNECNEADPYGKNFETTINVEKTYQVINNHGNKSN